MYIGIDLGGTNIACGLVDETGKIIAQSSTPTDATRQADDIAEDIVRIAAELIKNAGLKSSDIKSIGIGCPGAVDDKSGMVVLCNNIKMRNYPLAKFIYSKLDIPVHLINDADAAAYGEYSVNGKGCNSFVFITLGTGVGGGIILNGKLYNGFNGAGGELGHMTLVHDGEKCSCGKAGCWEAYASVTALIRQTKAAMEKNPESLMNKIAQREGKVNGKTAFEAAKQGDKAGHDVVYHYLRYIADGIVSIINIFQPEKLVIGGGISKEGDYMLKPIDEFVKMYEYNQLLPRARVEIATLHNDAGIIGAALAHR